MVSTYTIKFKATKRLFNLFNLRMFHSIKVDVEEVGVGAPAEESLEEMQYVIEEYSKFKNLTSPKLISYTRHC